MKIVNCPKGGRVPDGYCRTSCLNYPGRTEMEKRVLAKIPEHIHPIKQHLYSYSLKWMSTFRRLLRRLHSKEATGLKDKHGFQGC